MTEQANRQILTWLFIVCVLVSLMVSVGGYVRLTRSGLSIVEWNPITGVVPPIGEEAWQREFAKYQQTPEYKLVNAQMTLDGYKSIFYLEWAHRLIARVAGLIVVLPLAYFLWKGIIPWRRSAIYLVIAALFAFQGFMGWYMVSSGLVENPHVSHFRLTLHLLVALTLLAITLWTALNRVYGVVKSREKAHWAWPAALALGLIVIQISYGGLTAGLKAGHVSNSWPLMSGELVPPGLLSAGSSLVESLLEAPATVHFIHRWFAFVVLAIAVWFFFRRGAGTGRNARQVRRASLGLIAVVSAQIILGISVVLFNVALPLALLHQAVALVMFVVAVYLNHRLAHA